jgi:hypothetical protein
VTDQPETLLSVALEIRELIRLMAEPVIAQRDEKPRSAIRLIVGKSEAKRQAVVLMDGSRSQTEIRQLIKIDQGDLSKMVKALRSGGLLSADEKPRLAIALPANFFESTEGQ